MKKYVLIAALLVALSLLFGCVNYDGDNGADSTSDTINIGGDGAAAGGTESGSSDAGSEGAGETGSGTTGGTETNAGEGTATDTSTGDSDAGTSDANAGETTGTTGEGESGTATDTGAAATPQTYTINIQNFAFSPAQLTIKKGDSVTWTNLDSVAHTATSDTGAFDSGSLGKNASWTRTFNETGTFNYHCAPHTYMTAKIIVE